MKDHYRIFQAWAHKSVFQDADAWIQEHFTQDQAHWDWLQGKSWINNVAYPSQVYFKNPDDYLMFKLRFGEICV